MQRAASEMPAEPPPAELSLSLWQHRQLRVDRQRVFRVDGGAGSPAVFMTIAFLQAHSSQFTNSAIFTNLRTTAVVVVVVLMGERALRLLALLAVDAFDGRHMIGYLPCSTLQVKVLMTCVKRHMCALSRISKHGES